MKKIGLVAIAAAMGIGFSSFTVPAKTQFWYQDPLDATNFLPINGTACTPGTKACTLSTPDGVRPIYYTASTANPVTKQ